MVSVVFVEVSCVDEDEELVSGALDEELEVFVDVAEEDVVGILVVSEVVVVALVVVPVPGKLDKAEPILDAMLRTCFFSMVFAWG